MKKPIALLAAIIIFSGILGGTFSAYKAIPAYAAGTTVETAAVDPVLAVFNGTDILESEVKAMIDRMVSYGSLEDQTDYKGAAEYIVNNKVLQAKIGEMGLDNFTAEELTSFANEANIQWEKALEDYVTYNLSEDTPEARAALRTKAEEYYKANGYTQEALLENLQDSASFDRLNDYLLGDYQPGEEEILAVFNQYGAQYQANYEGNVPMYEYMTSYNGSESWYVPEGYRGIIHILLAVDETLLTEFKNLQAAYEESQSGDSAGSETAEQTESPAVNEAVADPNATTVISATEPPAATAASELPLPESTEVTDDAAVLAVPVTLAQVDAARAAVLSSQQETIDQITARLASGETFISLIAEYGSDPGMQDAETLANGYSVHKESIIYDPVFTAAAFSDKMQKIGDVSDPVVGQYGIHILFYLRDIPGGLIMTDEIRTQIYDYLYSKKASEVYSQALLSWNVDFSITYNDDAIAAATEKAAAIAAAAAPAETEGATELEGTAVPEVSQSPDPSATP